VGVGWTIPIEGFWDMNLRLLMLGGMGDLPMALFTGW
jgi:hypothetical protein